MHRKINILFLTLVKVNSLDERGIYQDLLRKFIDEKYNVTVVTPVERREKIQTNLIKTDEYSILKVKTFNLQKTNIIEKGIGTLAIEFQYLKAIKKYFKDIKFDLILYSTPPITFSKIIEFIKRRDHAYAYLLLKDIFPQNAIDMKMFKPHGFLHNTFLKKERKLYELSNTIGCMSEANRNYVLKHNPFLKAEKVEVNPNTITPVLINQSEAEKIEIRTKYNIPLDKKIFVYGGNLGKPQGLDFLLDTIEATTRPDIYFLIVGSGTEYERIYQWFKSKNPANAQLRSSLPKEDYDVLLNACDVGMIFLNKNFTIPNFPSRLLSYLEMKMPVIAATDEHTDIGKVIAAAACGYWVQSGDQIEMQDTLNKLLDDTDTFEKMKENAWHLLKDKYTVDVSYELIKSKL